MEKPGILKEIEEKEKLARQLEPDAATRRLWMEKVFAYADTFLNSIDKIPAFTIPDVSFAYPAAANFPDAGTGIDELLHILEKEVDHPGLNPASGGHLGYIPGGGIFPSALGDFLADVFNRYAGVHFASPGAVEMEHEMIEWMRNLFGFPDSTLGTLTSGGSIANLVAIVTARDAKQLKAADFSRAVIYLTSQVHHCVFKAIRIAGLAECQIREIETDEMSRMRMDSLQAQIQKDKNENRIPFLLVGSAGTTDTGAVDPLGEMARIASEEQLWFHVDAAYGGFFQLTGHGRQILKGIEKADSLVVDPHKGLFLPYGSGAVLIRNGRHLHESHFYRASYMQDANRDPHQLSPADLSPELTRHFRGLRMWLPIKLFGIHPFRAALEEKLLLTRYFRNEVVKLEGMIAGPEPQLSVLTFRCEKPGRDSNELNTALVRAVHADGRVFLSSTTIQGQVWLRLACLSFRTHRSTIELALDVLNQALKTLG